MEAIIFLLEIRCRQLYRLLASVGWPLLMIGIPMIIIFLLGLFERSTYGYYLGTIFLLALFVTHFNRKDKWHLVHLGYKPRQIFILEYLVCSFILGGLQYILVGTLQNIGLMMVGSIIVGVLPQVGFSSLLKIFMFPVEWIPVSYFEWRVGIRKSGWGLIGITAACVFFSYTSPIFSLVGIILTSIIATSWHKDFESMSMMQSDISSIEFLSKKMCQSIVWILLICSPLIVAFLVFHFELWYLLLVALFFGWLINSFAICYKYAGYHPSRKSAQSDLAVAIFSYSALVPFFMPVCFVYFIIYARRAHLNISYINASS